MNDWGVFDREICDVWATSIPSRATRCKKAYAYNAYDMEALSVSDDTRRNGAEFSGTKGRRAGKLLHCVPVFPST